MTRAMKIFIGIITVIILALYFGNIYDVDGKEVDAITWIDNIFGLFVGYLFAVLFYKIMGFPLIVLILISSKGSMIILKMMDKSVTFKPSPLHYQPLLD